ncbi:hypothetical protein SAY86_006323 [Trapa natans]|uniref:DUF3456 domain-containing protein n=1 Tax=Trapa natans TaxID=22666 RepID=A0AAN7LBU1_TRANT|nr:hypothetical protein SAY86_006323 [Trapa natans]
MLLEGQLESLIKIVSENIGITEGQAAAAGLLAELPQAWLQGQAESLRSEKEMLSPAGLLLFAIISIAHGGVDDKCAACNAIAGEIEIGLSNEKPRNHLDMRHRLDSKGQREGKLIDYRVSELRVVELLDGLCEKMQDYTLEKRVSANPEWVKVYDWDELEDNKQEARAHSKAISSYCGRLLAELIMKGSVEVGSVSRVLCQDLSKHCRSGTNMVDREDDDDESEAEL